MSNRRLRAAFLSVDPLGSSGWARYTRDLITALAGCGVDIVLITSTDAPPAIPASEGLPLAAYHRVLPPLIPAPRLSSLRLLASIPAVRRAAAGCDVVHAAVEPYALAALATLPVRRLFVTAHGTFVPIMINRPLFGALYRFLYRRATILCVSSYTASQVQAVLPAAHTRVIPNGVNVARYRQAPPEKPSPPSLLPEGEGREDRERDDRVRTNEKHPPTILSVGQAKPRKGYHLLAQAMRQVRAVIPDAQAVFIGDTSDTAYVAQIQAQLTADGLEDAVHFLGRVSDEILLGWYHTADVFALPALNSEGSFEGFGLAYLEASAAGLPVVGTWNCGAEDAIRDGKTGFLITQNDPAALADVLIRLLGHADLRAQMGAAGAAFATEHGWDRVAQRVLDVYREVSP